MRDIYSDGYNSLWLYVIILTASLLMIFIPNVWLFLLVNLVMIITSWFFSLYFTVIFSMIFFFYTYILIASYKECRNSILPCKPNWKNEFQEEYLSTRLSAINMFAKVFRFIGISDEENIEYILKNFTYKDGKISWDYFLANKAIPVKKSKMLFNWKYKHFWLLTGCCQMKISEIFPKDSLILMAFIPDDYKYIQSHKYCLVFTKDTENAIFVETNNIPPDTTSIFAVSTGHAQFSVYK